MRECDPEQAANLRARAALMQQIATIVKKNRWTQTEAAQRCGITQPRMNDLCAAACLGSHSMHWSTLPPRSAGEFTWRWSPSDLIACCQLRFERPTRGFIVFSLLQSESRVTTEMHATH
jgi:hypothetical protein